MTIGVFIVLQLAVKKKIEYKKISLQFVKACGVNQLCISTWTRF